mmetsp:Transcript_66977/g.153682  ORF Transcript_66977/g.153682 Transcript_66977/m.153682 type:complete len:242 (-) Transcript_66977:977-1702(-)
MLRRVRVRHVRRTRPVRVGVPISEKSKDLSHTIRHPLVLLLPILFDDSLCGAPVPAHFPLRNRSTFGEVGSLVLRLENLSVNMVALQPVRVCEIDPQLLPPDCHLRFRQDAVNVGLVDRLDMHGVHPLRGDVGDGGSRQDACEVHPVQCPLPVDEAEVVEGILVGGDLQLRPRQVQGDPRQLEPSCVRRVAQDLAPPDLSIEGVSQREVGALAIISEGHVHSAEGTRPAILQQPVSARVPH